MNRLIRIALIAGFTVLFERAVRRQLDDRQQQRAIAKAVRNGFATDARQAFFGRRMVRYSLLPGRDLPCTFLSRRILAERINSAA